jgi:starch phosphorylase
MAGKAHPADLEGQALVQQWVRFARRPEARAHVIFLSDYDMVLTERLVQGVDVWLNTPRRPWEACGTSGMKVLVNGGLNLSELDGWWAEAYSPQVGWALGDGREHDGDPDWDAIEATQLYELLEQEVIPEFYQRDEQGIPRAWVNRMRESMAQLTPRFSATRAVREYTQRYYLPAAEAYRRRATDRGAIGVKIVERRRLLEQQWPALRLGEVHIGSGDGQHLFDAQVYLDGLDPASVQVELYAEALDEAGPQRLSMQRMQPLAGALNGFSYQAAVPATRAATDYTVRIIPGGEDVAVPLEDAHILWQER